MEVGKVNVGKVIAEKINDSVYDGVFREIYGEEFIEIQKKRYILAIHSFYEIFGGNEDIGIFSVPGRTELCGNHTDHNNGLVLTAAVNIDVLSVAAVNGSRVIRIFSEGYGGLIEVDLALPGPDKKEFGLPAGMVRGVAAGVRDFGCKTGGFDAYITSDVKIGGGLSSSASFEVTIGVILNNLFNGGRLTPIELAKIGRYAENSFFGKPCGLQDQLACAVGGVITIDLADPATPKVSRMDFDLDRFKLKMVITETKGNHADLTEEYASIRTEMASAAAVFGKNVLNDVDPGMFFPGIPGVRKAAGDRAVIRAIHFFEENKRVTKLASAIREGRIDDALKLIIESGHSSFEYNQNAYSKNAADQEIPIALAMSQWLLAGRGAWRLQGGGFAGTIQAYVPFDLVDAYCHLLGGVFGQNASKILTIRKNGCLMAPFD